LTQNTASTDSTQQHKSIVQHDKSRELHIQVHKQNIAYCLIIISLTSSPAISSSHTAYQTITTLHKLLFPSHNAMALLVTGAVTISQETHH